MLMQLSPVRNLHDSNDAHSVMLTEAGLYDESFSARVLWTMPAGCVWVPRKHTVPVPLFTWRRPLFAQLPWRHTRPQGNCLPWKPRS